MSREDGEARLEAEALMTDTRKQCLRRHIHGLHRWYENGRYNTCPGIQEETAVASDKPWTMESFMETSAPAPPEFTKVVDDYGSAVEQLVLAKAQVHKWTVEAARLRCLLIELVEKD